MSDVGSNILAKMILQGISQNRLAKLSGVSQSAISSIINQTKSPSVDTVSLLARALNCSVSELLGESDQDALSAPDRQLLGYAHMLNAVGLEKLMEYARDLTENDRYLKNASAKAAE